MMVADFALGVCAGLVLGYILGRMVADRLRGAPTSTLTKKAVSRFPFSWLPDKKPSETPKPLGSIPRTSGPWRRQRLAIQKAHNSKQKERDALIPKEQPNAKTR